MASAGSSNIFLGGNIACQNYIHIKCFCFLPPTGSDCYGVWQHHGKRMTPCWHPVFKPGTKVLALKSHERRVEMREFVVYVEELLARLLFFQTLLHTLLHKCNRSNNLTYFWGYSAFWEQRQKKTNEAKNIKPSADSHVLLHFHWGQWSTRLWTAPHSAWHQSRPACQAAWWKPALIKKKEKKKRNIL